MRVLTLRWRCFDPKKKKIDGDGERYVGCYHKHVEYYFFYSNKRNINWNQVVDDVESIVVIVEILVKKLGIEQNKA